MNRSEKGGEGGTLASIENSLSPLSFHIPVTTAPSPKPTSAIRKATLLSFVFVMYSYTTGGPFGLEDQVSNSGPGMTLLYHLLIPLFWCIPISLVAAELTTAMPVQGGFYRWVRAAFGDAWVALAARSN
jgi:amino acid transporter